MIVPTSSADLLIEHLPTIMSNRDESPAGGGSLNFKYGPSMKMVVDYLIEKTTYNKLGALRSELLKDAVYTRAALLLRDANGGAPRVRITFTDAQGRYIDKDLSDFLGFRVTSAEATTANTRPCSDWQATLNRHLEAIDANVRVRGVASVLPTLEEQGPYEIPSALLEQVEASRGYLNRLGAPNDSVAVIDEPTVLEQMPHTINVKSLDYATLRVLRQTAKDQKKPAPKVPSANVVLFCEDQRVLIVHRRAKGVMAGTTVDSVMHTFGGSYCSKPPNSRRVHDHGDLLRTARREVLEESNLSFGLEEAPLFLQSEETDSGFVQWVLMARGISLFEFHNVVFRENDPEGVPLSVPFDSLREVLNRPAMWHQSGRTHILAWLAMGAPGARGKLSFGGLTAQELFEAVMQ